MAAVGSCSVKCVLTITRSSAMHVHTVEDHSDCNWGNLHFSTTLKVSTLYWSSPTKSYHKSIRCFCSTCGFYRYAPQFQTSIPSYMELPVNALCQEYIAIGTNNKQYRGCGDRKRAWPQFINFFASMVLFQT